MDMIARQHALHDMRPHLVAGKDNDFMDPITHRTREHLLAIFRDPQEAECLIKSRARGCRAEHAEADGMEAGGSVQCVEKQHLGVVQVGLIALLSTT
jgi:hypothetical protein